MKKFIRSNLVDILGRLIYPIELKIEHGKIQQIVPLERETTEALPFVLPGFIDAHVHIESSMLIPSEFARLAVVHGTVATVSDPHEIANVCGMEGVEFMIENGKKVPFKFYFGAPSCVPATHFETAGAKLDYKEVKLLLDRPEIWYLSEMMNFPGVLHKDKDVMQKIASANLAGKPVDGHAPGLRGREAKEYADAGISTDHECFTKEEALDKLKYGMKIIIREGSAAKNFEALIDLLNDYPDKIMFCSDDKHPDSLVEGHINQLCARAISKGINLFKVLKAACINPVLHYRLPVGQLRENDPADFIVVKNLENFEVLQTYINGQLVAENGKSLIQAVDSKEPINNFKCKKKKISDFDYPVFDQKGPEKKLGYEKFSLVMEALDGQLITNKFNGSPSVRNGKAESNIDEDILKIVVANRYKNVPIAKAFVKNFGLKRGAIASSVAHDSHNIVAVGTENECLCRAINLIIEQQGGISCVSGETELILPLPVAGLMSNEDGYFVAAAYTTIDKMAKGLGTLLSAPFMTLSFMSLLVIPHLKLSDRGLFDGDEFTLL
jgi:adenine deaminase